MKKTPTAIDDDIERFKHIKDAKPYDGLESNLQKACASYLNKYTKHVWVHVPNEAKRSYKLAKHLQQQGMKGGLPDILIFDSLMAIELKAKKNKPTQSQIEWLKALEGAGWRVCWVNNFDEFLDILKQK